MKKLLFLVLTFLLIFPQAGCSNPDIRTSSAPETVPPLSSESTEAAAPYKVSIPFAPQVVADNNSYRITVKSLYKSNIWACAIQVLLENKTEDQTITFFSPYTSINGMMCDSTFMEDVPAQKRALTYIMLPDDSFPEGTAPGSEDITHIALYLNTRSQNGTEAVSEEPIHIYPYGKEKVSPYSRTPGREDIVIIDNEQLSAVIIRCKESYPHGYHVSLLLRNKTEQNITFYTDQVKLNNIMVDPCFITGVLPGQCKFTDIAFSHWDLEKAGITDINTIDFEFTSHVAGEEIVTAPVHLSLEQQHSSDCANTEPNPSLFDPVVTFPQSGASDPTLPETVPALSSESTKAASPDEVPIPFTPQVVAENDLCRLTVKRLYKTQNLTCAIHVLFENKTEDQSLMITSRNAALNGLMCGSTWSQLAGPTSVIYDSTGSLLAGPKSSREFIIELPASSFPDGKEPEAQDMRDIALGFYIDNLKGTVVFDEIIHIYPYGEQNVKPFSRTPSETDKVIFDNEQACAIITGFEKANPDEYHLSLFLQNKTDKAVIFFSENDCINDNMIESSFHTAVMPGGCIFESMEFPQWEMEEAGITSIDTIEFSFIARQEKTYGNDTFNDLVHFVPEH